MHTLQFLSKLWLHFRHPSRREGSFGFLCLGGVKSELLDLEYDVWWTGDLPEDPGDNEILTIAKSQTRILVTLDKDFGELVFLHGVPHSGILRLIGIPSKLQGTSIHQVLVSFGKQLVHGAIITLKEDRIRMRLPLLGLSS